MDKEKQNNKGRGNMNLNELVAKNNQKIFNIAERNTVRNEDGLTVVKKDDPWRREDDVPLRPFVGSKKQKRRLVQV
ncbi:hypothetical protein PDN43_14390 [Bacillus cereus]|nr:hypothetical protein [Bacillus cereus]MDA2306081.1 hypothetical protein [Bacillus cereus]